MPPLEACDEAGRGLGPVRPDFPMADVLDSASGCSRSARLLLSPDEAERRLPGFGHGGYETGEVSALTPARWRCAGDSSRLLEASGLWFWASRREQATGSINPCLIQVSMHCCPVAGVFVSQFTDASASGVGGDEFLDLGTREPGEGAPGNHDRCRVIGRRRDIIRDGDLVRKSQPRKQWSRHQIELNRANDRHLKSRTYAELDGVQHAQPEQIERPWCGVACWAASSVVVAAPQLPQGHYEPCRPRPPACLQLSPRTVLTGKGG
jgi:hypothetical protein